MDEAKLEVKASAVGVIVGSLIGLGAGFLIACIFDINPLKEYGWIGGYFHGTWGVFNWIISWFNGDVFMKAPLHTNAYNAFWWIGFIFSVWLSVRSLLIIIANLRKLFK